MLKTHGKKEKEKEKELVETNLQILCVCVCVCENVEPINLQNAQVSDLFT